MQTRRLSRIAVMVTPVGGGRTVKGCWHYWLVRSSAQTTFWFSLRISGLLCIACSIVRPLRPSEERLRYNLCRHKLITDEAVPPVTLGR